MPSGPAIRSLGKKMGTIGEETLLVTVSDNVNQGVEVMKALIVGSLFALAIAMGVTASEAAPPGVDATETSTPADGCHSLSVYGVWDCR